MAKQTKTEKAARALLKINPNLTAAECGRKVNTFMAYMRSRESIGLNRRKVYA